MTETQIIKVGNPNRLVKVVRKKYRTKKDIDYLFNTLTGEIVYFDNDLYLDHANNLVILSDHGYPVYENGVYKGYNDRGKLILPHRY